MTSSRRLPELTAAKKSRPKKMVGSVARAIEIINYLNEAKKEAGVVKIARDLGMNSSTCFNILQTLVYYDLVEVDPETRLYRLGLGIAALAERAFDPGQSLARARADMTEVALRLDLSISLWRKTSADRMTMLAVAEGLGAVRLRMDVGQRLPIAGGAMGRVLAAYGSIAEDQLYQQFLSVRWHRPISWQTFQEEVASARKHGWFADHGTFIRNAVTVSVPVPNGGASPVLICSASFVERQLAKSAVPGIAKDLQELAARIAALPGLN